MHTREIVVVGYVQGVGFRSFVEQTARVAHVRGEVWNGRDQNVWVVAQHEDENVLKRFQEEMWDGPGRVDEVRAQEVERALYSNFVIGLSR